MEQEIIQPIAKEVLKKELTPELQLRMTNKSHNEIYVVTAHNAPNVMKEIGRLREIAFREAGGGTGKAMDIDEFDTCENCYKQLIVWNPEAEEIIGGYRYLEGTSWEMDEKGQPKLATSHMFHFLGLLNSGRYLVLHYFSREYTLSFTYCAHSIGLLLLSNVCQGIGFPIVTRKVLCTFLYISSTRKSIAKLNGKYLSLKLARR